LSSREKEICAFDKKRAAEKHILHTLNGEKGGRAKEKGTRKGDSS